MVTYIQTNLPVNVIVGLAHPPNGDMQGQEMSSVPSADNQTHNYNAVPSKHHPFPSTVRSKGSSRHKMKWGARYIQIYQ